MDLKSTTKEELNHTLETSKSLREVIIKYGLSSNGSGGYRNIKRKIKSFDLEVPSYKYYGMGGRMTRRSNDEIFIEHSTHPRHRVKDRVIKDKLLDYECKICGNVGEYNDKPLSLHLDHINGVGNDNRLTNLRFLCPNCHSQTETYGGKNVK